MNKKLEGMEGPPTGGGEVKHSARALTASFQYLDVLRDSGITNMYGAAPYLIRDLGRSRDKAVSELSLWMKTFSKDAPSVRARAALSTSAQLGGLTK